MCASHTSIMSVKICTLSSQKTLCYIRKRLKQECQTVVFTPNTEMLLSARKDFALTSLLNSSTLNIPDGIGVRIAARLQGKPRLARSSGIDTAQKIWEVAAQENYRIFLLGGKSGVARRAAKMLKLCYPALKICGTHHGYFNKSGEDNLRIIRKINSSHPDILFVCFGFPLQENWICENISKIPSVKLAIGLGGTLDVWSGNIRRAPKIIRNLGFEWLWRVALEPRRAKIFIDIPQFLWAVRAETRKSKARTAR